MSGQFESLRASQLYCQKCKKAMTVRERLLLVLPDKEVFDYLCTGCASSLGTREVSLAQRRMQDALRMQEAMRRQGGVGRVAPTPLRMRPPR